MGIFKEGAKEESALMHLLSQRVLSATTSVDAALSRLLEAQPDLQDSVSEAVKDGTTRAAILEGWYIDADGCIDSPALMALRRTQMNALEKRKAELRLAAERALDAINTAQTVAQERLNAETCTVADIPDFMALPAVKDFLES